MYVQYILKIVVYQYVKFSNEIEKNVIDNVIII